MVIPNPVAGVSCGLVVASGLGRAGALGGLGRQVHDIPHRSDGVSDGCRKGGQDQAGKCRADHQSRDGTPHSKTQWETAIGEGTNFKGRKTVGRVEFEFGSRDRQRIFVRVAKSSTAGPVLCSWACVVQLGLCCAAGLVLCGCGN